jgi:hypothetical protein
MPSASTVNPQNRLHAIIFNRWVLIAIGLWILAHAVVLLLAGGQLPFDRPALAGLSFASQVATPTVC